ncbi:hypothetical protein [Streptomyces narbonensis]|uniref:hypothetical protein n=1 Tax=Streptomyces narbonensis TaxID=67333 RepID=UPI00340DDE37
MDKSPYIAELLDSNEEPVHRVLAEVTPLQSCDTAEVEQFRVTALLGLSPDAVSVQLRRDDLVLWHREIPEAPTLSVHLAAEAVSREEPVQLRFELSQPGESAYLQLVYQWGERRFRTLGFTDPQGELTVDLRQVPGGPACRFVALYSNGLRTAVAATDEFPLEPLGPSIAIIEPSNDTEMTTGQPLVLHGQAVDPERPGGARAEDLSWWLDDERVATGPIGGIDLVEPGDHRISLRYEGPDRTGQDEVRIIVVPAQAPTAEEWEPFDEFTGY